MSLTVHELALRLGKQIGVSSFDPGRTANTHPLLPGGAYEGDLEAVVTAINGALAEMWDGVPASAREGVFGVNACPHIELSDVGAASDAQVFLPIPNGWDEAVVLPLAMRRLLVHPQFQAGESLVEIERQAVWALRFVQKCLPVNGAGEVPKAGKGVFLKCDFR